MGLNWAGVGAGADGRDVHQRRGPLHPERPPRPAHEEGPTLSLSLSLQLYNYSAAQLTQQLFNSLVNYTTVRLAV